MLAKRSVYFLFSLGILLRAPALPLPIQEGYRNAQTAALTANMMEEGHLRFDPIAPWRGDLDARLLQELPLYNVLVFALDKFSGVGLDPAGRLVSLFFWAVAFGLLQILWRIALIEPARPWANLLFVLAPMNWYLSTAFMPETLLQCLSIGFVVLTLKFAEGPSWKTGAFLGTVAALGLLIKLPSFVHLGLFLFLTLMDRQGWRGLLHPVLLFGAVAILGILWAWARCMESVNSAYFPYWTGWENLRGFVQPHVSRLSTSFWIPLMGYNLAFILPVLVAPLAAWGFWDLVRSWKDFQNSRIWLYLLTSLIVSWLVWAKGAASQNYYNLPNLVLFSAAFGLGAAHATEYLRMRGWGAPALKLAGAGVVLLVASWGTAGYRYLSRPDRLTLEVAQWVRENTRPEDLILFQPRHNPAVMDYEHQPLLSYASGRRTWIWTRSTPDWEKEKALQKSKFLVISNPAATSGWGEKIRQFFKGSPHPVPDAASNQQASLFFQVFSGNHFSIYQNRSLP